MEIYSEIFLIFKGIFQKSTVSEGFFVTFQNTSVENEKFSTFYPYVFRRFSTRFPQVVEKFVEKLCNVLGNSVKNGKYLFVYQPRLMDLIISLMIASKAESATI